MGRDKKIQNALKRSEIHRKQKREKAQVKLKRRMENKKEELDKVSGKQKREERLSKNVPRTLDNTRVFDSSSYLTADPRTLLQPKPSKSEVVKESDPDPDSVDGSGDEDEDEDEDEEMPEAGPSSLRTAAADPEDEGGNEEEEEEGEASASAQPAPTGFSPPPRILITTSASPCKETYAFCDDLKNVFPGGELFKRPKGRGFELGRISRWAAKRKYNAMLVVNEDHKSANAITLIVLPAGPTAYFKLTSVQLGSQIFGHAKPSPHSPELILNNFTTILGNSVGRLFASLFPPQPQFRGRQVVTLHNQRDFLFFRRHRYMFASPTSAKLQEIGPRFTLKLRWLRKGLPSVTAADGSIPRPGGKEEMDHDDDFEDDVEQGEAQAENEAMEEMVSGKTSTKSASRQTSDAARIPPLDEEQEYEWKWKPKMEVSRRTFFL